MIFCLPGQFVEKVKQAFRDGTLDPVKLSEMDSKGRRELLSKIVGEESAKNVNLLFEKKLLLKNQEKAMYDFAREITGLSAKDKAETLERIRKNFEERNKRIYEPMEDEVFLNELTSDIYSKKYKTEVSLDQAQTITELAQDMNEAKEALSTSGKPGYGAAKVALDNYVNAIKNDTIKSEFINPLKEKGIIPKAQALIEDSKIAVNFIAENSRSMVASLDNSLWFRQGMRALTDYRTSDIWVKDFAKSWKDIYTTVRGNLGEKNVGVKELFSGKDAIRAGDAVIDAVKAEIYERPNFTNGRYLGKPGEGKAGTKLDIGTGEESYPTSQPSKIPVFGRFFKGSEVAYEGGAMRLRVDIADKIYSLVEKAGVDLRDNRIVGDLNEVINGMTGRGTFGGRAAGFEKATNKAFFSIKFFKSNLDYLTVHQGRLSTPATKLAATNLLNTVVTTGLVLGLAKALNPDDNKEIFNNRSTNFGKIRVGKATFDLTHGAGGIVVLLSRILSQKTVNTKTGRLTKLGERYGSADGMDILWNFTENKFSPMFSTIRDLIRQKTFEGNKPTLVGELGKLTVPIMIQNISQFRGETLAMQIIALIADGLGINVNIRKRKR